MKHRAKVAKTVAEAIRAIDSMPKERGTDFYAGRTVSRSVNRTYTRIDGDQFQVSRTAGMGSPVVVSGKIADDDSGNAVIFLSTSFGFLPLGSSLAAAFVVLAIGLYFLNAGKLYLAASFAILSAYAFSWFVGKFWEARYLRSKLSEHLGGVTWEWDK